MAAIIGVHGIMNQQLGRHQLIDGWGPALADGLERAAGHREDYAKPLIIVSRAAVSEIFLKPTTRRVKC